MKIGPHSLSNRLILAPMAGVTDRPFRRLCRRYGAGMTVSEMISSNPALRHDRKTRLRTDHTGEPGPRSTQILGNDPADMAEAARFNAGLGAQIIDINMGCPAKKVCSKAAGSALMRDEMLVASILRAVVSAVDIPVTLKIRTGWDTTRRNAVNIARIAEDSGIQAITIHGRTRACGFSGSAEYSTIGHVKQSVSIPVIANGDIDSPQKALDVLRETGADAIMIGRAALGKPWLFRQIEQFLDHGETASQPGPVETRDVILEHVRELHEFYGHHQGIRIARKHVGWYFGHLNATMDFRHSFNTANEASEQLAMIASALEAGWQDTAP